MANEYPIAPVKRSRLSQQIVLQICDLIRQGQIRPGSRLPPERELAERLQVSRTSLREALSVLEVSGLTETRHGGGTWVRDIDEFGVTSPLALVLSTSETIVGDLWEVRIIFEPPIAARAAVRATSDDIVQLKMILDCHLDTPRDDVEQLMHLDREFHTLIARSTRNNVSLRVIQLINDLLAERRHHGAARSLRDLRTLTRHTEIYEAIRDRDPSAASDAMLTHLDELQRGLLDRMVTESDSTE